MAFRDIRVIGDPVLRTPCEPITEIDERVKQLVEDLLETVDADGRAGLAANQIGVGLRAFFLGTSMGKWTTFLILVW